MGVFSRKQELDELRAKVLKLDERRAAAEKEAAARKAEVDLSLIHISPLGRAVNQVMLEQFPDIVDPTFSADMEKKLDVVEAGKADWVKTVDDFYQGFEKSLEAAEKNMYTEEQMRRDIIKGLELLKRQRERNRDAR